MRKYLCFGIALMTLVACGDPLAGLDRISEVELAETDPVANALPSEAEVAREGFLGTQAAEPTEAALAAADVAAKDAAPQRGGLLGLLRRLPRAVPEDGVDTVAVSAAVADANTGTDELLDLEDEPVQLAALTPEIPRKRVGLFGRVEPGAFTSTKSEDVRDVAYGTVLPYGEIARSCEARRKPIGRKIESASARGYKLYDSNPRATGMRTYYITGFADDCPRQLTAANVILGAPSRYEELHYGPTGRDLPSGATDAAYEKVKRTVCGTRKGKPCGRKIGQMDRSTFFVSSYASLTANARWAEVLIHDGIVMATALKTYQ